MDYLEQIANLLNCGYMSDIRRTIITEAQATEIIKISSPEFTLADYIDAANYILEDNAEYTNIEDAKQAIITRLMHRAL